MIKNLNTTKEQYLKEKMDKKLRI